MGGKGAMFNLLILLALAAAGVSIFLVSKLVDQAKLEAAKNAKPVDLVTKTVLVATQDLTPGTEFLAASVQPKTIPEQFVPADAVSKFEDLEGKVAATFIPAGDMIFASKAKSRDQLNKPSLVLEPGKRLISLPIDDISSTAHLVKNGDRVDVIAIFEVEKFERDIEGTWLNRKVATIVMQNVRVFEIQFGTISEANSDRAAAGDGRMGRGMNVTFEVSPEDAERAILMRSVTGQYALALRRFDDLALVDNTGMVESELLKGFKPEAPPPPPPAPEVVPEAPAPPPRRPFY
jgi:pilus assembly protein CpaB